MPKGRPTWWLPLPWQADSGIGHGTDTPGLRMPPNMHAVVHVLWNVNMVVLGPAHACWTLAGCCCSEWTQISAISNRTNHLWCECVWALQRKIIEPRNHSCWHVAQTLPWTERTLRAMNCEKFYLMSRWSRTYCMTAMSTVPVWQRPQLESGFFLVCSSQ